MTPAQLTALRAEILARADCATAVTARDIDTIAALISVNRVSIQSVSAAKALTWAASGPMERIVDASNQVGSLARSSSLSFLRSLSSGMDQGLDNAQVLSAFQGWKSLAIITQAEYDSLMAMASDPNPVTRTQVADALYNADGTQK
jgi:hypothetical protein